MKKSVYACLLAVMVFLTSCSASGAQTEKTESFFAMDTYITLIAYGENTEAALTEAKTKMEMLKHLWSVTDKNSEIYAINHSGGKPITVSDETADLLSFALDMAKKTDGALEPTIYSVLTAWGFICRFC